MSDPRHHPVLCEIDRLYKQHNGDLPMPSLCRAVKALSDLLAENPKWPLERLIACVRNRFQSRGLNLAAPPHVWIKTLPQYAAGALDQWGRPVQNAVGRKQKGEDTERAVEDYWARRMGHGGI